MERAISIDVDGLERAASQASAHPVIEVISERIRTGSQPGARVDGARVALSIEGGGMRGVVSAGMVAALEDLGALSAFDDIYGASAGSFNGAYLISGRARLGTTIYYEDVNNRNFIDLRRALRGQPILSLDYMLDVVAESIKPIDWEGVIASPVRLHPIAFSLSEQRPVDLPYETKAELKLALRASSSIPWVAGDPVRIGEDRLFWDSSFRESIPFHAARDQGATHILALTTRPRGVLRGKPSSIERYFMSRKVARFGRELVPLYLERPESYAADIAFITDATESPTSEGTQIYGITLPPDEPRVSQLESDRQKLVAGAVAGFKAVYKVLDGREPAAAHELRGFFF